MSASQLQHIRRRNYSEEMDSLWLARKEGMLKAIASKPEGTALWATDVAVPISPMADLIGEL